MASKPSFGRRVRRRLRAGQTVRFIALILGALAVVGWFFWASSPATWGVILGYLMIPVVGVALPFTVRAIVAKIVWAIDVRYPDL